MCNEDVNGCSGGMTKLWNTIFKVNPPWNYCCDSHDRAYNRGGDHRLRKRADLRLALCVCTNGHPIWSAIMYIAVRVFGPLYWHYQGLCRYMSNEHIPPPTPVQDRYYIVKLDADYNATHVLREYISRLEALESLELTELSQGYSVAQYVQSREGTLVMRPVWSSI